MSGYDIKKRVKAALGIVTNASYGTLYPTLHKLETEGAVEMQEVPQKSRPSKKVYHLTAKGRTELDQWLQEPPAADQVRREFLLKLYLADGLGTEGVRQLVECRRGETEAMLKLLSAERTANQNLRQAWMMDYALSIYNAEMDWLKRVEAQLGIA